MSEPGRERACDRAVSKGIINERESQLRLVTSVRLRWTAVFGQLAAVALITLFTAFR